MAWTFEFHEAAEAEYLAQPPDIQASLERVRMLVSTFGLERIPAKYAKNVRGPLWEFRLKGRDGIARALYVTRTGKRVVVVRVFTKKSQKTPPREIDLALARAAEVT
jgi:phage-related protein